MEKRSRQGCSAGDRRMPRILVLDDLPDAAILIKRILAAQGEVAAFADEQEALAFAAGNRVDLAVLDIKLKQMNGIDVLRALKSANPAMKAVILTGYPTEETRRESRKLGAAAYCVKPVDTDELEATVAAVLSGDL